MADRFYTELVQEIKKKKPSKDALNRIKIRLSKKYRMQKIPTDIEIFLNADEKDVPVIRRYVQTKPTRTISGVSVVAVMTKPFRCPHGRCIQCPGGVDSAFGTVPQSYTGKEPATLRAIRAGYDAYRQVFNRLEQYVVLGHSCEKVDLVIMGGTFPSFPNAYKQDFVTGCFRAMNDFSRLFFDKKGEFMFDKFKDFFELPGDIGAKKRIESIAGKIAKLKLRRTTLEREQKANERSNVRCIGLTIETRPDYADLKHANEMLGLGCTRVELGVQSIYDDVLKRIERGHDVEETVKATQLLKDLGFKINYHMMPGLPGSSLKRDAAMLNQIFIDDRFKPDMLKIYPCMVLKGTRLHNLWKAGKFKPMTTSQAANLIADFKKHVPEYCRIMRIQRDIPTKQTEAGVDATNLRQLVDDITRREGIICHCIRCREIKDETFDINPKKIRLKATTYAASHGSEFFIQAVYNDRKTKDRLVGFCRLRFPSQNLRKELTDDSTIVRELHVYGQSLEIGKKGKSSARSAQHRGIGRRLLEYAEEIAKTYYKDKMVVISGIGVRGYYKKLGYRLEGPYMVKRI